MTPRERFEELLCMHGQIWVILDSGASGVVLPGHLRGNVVLDYNLSAVVPIPDLEATDEGISATLSFQREPFKTFVPWSAVIGVAGAGIRPQESSKRTKLTVV